MKNEDYKDFINIMEELSNNFTKGDITKEKIDLYWNRLKKWPLSVIKRGCDYLIDIRVFHDFPTVGEINKAIKDSKSIR